jgi:ABC-2 type transport system permease protein
MKTILKIARTELALLFYSPIAWFLLVAFLFQAGLTYTGTLENFLTQQEMGGRGLKYLTFLTSKIFDPPFGIWPELVGKLYLYLPLLTMGLMSREINSGTIKLLYSSPIKVNEIVFGKFLAMMCYNLVLVLVLLVVVVCGLFNIHAADAGLLFSGLLGIYLLLCAYAAIGLFMSCLTSYQVVAALSTLVLLAVLNYIGSVWQGIDFVRDLTYFLSISGRTEHMLFGLITTKDILYFAVIAYMFLSFSIYKLRSDRESASTFVKARPYVLTVIFALALGYITSRPGLIGYFDATATKTMTLTKNTQKTLKETGDEPIEVTSYINLLDNHFYSGRPEERNQDLERWERYLRFKPDMTFKYVYFYDSTWDKNLYKYNPGVSIASLASKYAKSMKIDLDLFKTPAEIRKMINLRPEQNRYVMKLKYKDRTTFLRLYNDQLVFPSETETSAALKRLLQAKLPKIAFVLGESERSIDKEGDRQYKMLTNDITFRYSLVNQGFDVESVFLKDQEIPNDIAGLVIADPKVAFDTASLAKIRAYVASGGNLLIAGEPGKGALLNPLLQPLGVQLMDGMVVQPSKDFSPDLLRSCPTSFATAFTPTLMEDAEDSLPLTMRGAAALMYNTDGPFTITPMVMSGGDSWNKKIRPDQDQIESAEDGNSEGGVMTIMAASYGGYDGSSADQPGKDKKNSPWKGLVYSPEQGDQKGPLPVVVGLTRNVNGRQQRIVVSGDADFLSNAELTRYNPKTCNFDFSTSIFSWFSNGEFPIDTSRPLSKDKHLNLTDGAFLFLRILLLGILPGILLISGSILLIRRRRQ